ncbi:MAG: hypothetical protein Q8N94_08255 [Methanoregula sp.]|nr:hypothetical protein [Methanoregula sp.]
MKTPRLYLGAIALTCVIALVIGMAGAAGIGGPIAGIAGKMSCHAGPEKMLDRLEGQGIDVSAVRTACESGDTKTARTLMQQIMETHKDLMPFRNAFGKNAPGFGPGMMKNRLAPLEAKGYDVSAIRAAFESGDRETTRTLMRQFMEAHKDELPQPGAGRNRIPSRSVTTI